MNRLAITVLMTALCMMTTLACSNAGQATNEVHDSEKVASVADDGWPPGQLPDGLRKGTLRDDAPMEINDPDDTGRVLGRLKSNSLAAQERYGDRRVAISVWEPSIHGVAKPQLRWDGEGNRKVCVLDTTSANLDAARRVQDAQGDLLLSVLLDYERPGVMTKCRIHGYYDSKGKGYQPLFH